MFFFSYRIDRVLIIHTFLYNRDNHKRDNNIHPTVHIICCRSLTRVDRRTAERRIARTHSLKQHDEWAAEETKPKKRLQARGGGGVSRLVRAFLNSFAQRARALLQGELDVVVQQVSVFVQHHVVTRAVQLLKAQLARILIENLLNRILQLLP